ncbi:MFS transporter [Thermoleptolyngbya sp. PKUAC-SCTB121]|uniref:MFS transporter n=1 Tax=Thermoleptolyngbya sp. PKUAC-SCTB121 TaxID=2811482 RepID=UPI001965400E|nr:MFS transporter [Thermoleptolyngbya sp. PKUAC-SCTB121]
MISPVGRSPVLWRQVLGLAAVQSAITLMWVMYGAYVPQLLEQFGLPISLGVAIATLENALAIAFQPLMGSLSDRAQRWTGTRFPFIAVGVVLTAALFLAIPGITVLDTGTALRGLMLFVLVAWSLAMTVFHSPVLSLLGHYTTVSHLPLAASFLTVASGIVGTLAPVVNQMILNLGPLATFLVGSTVLLLAAALLRRLDAPVSFTLSGAIATDASPLPSLGSLSFLAAVGLCLGWGQRLMMDAVRGMTSTHLPGQNSNQIMLWVAIAIAVVAVPLGAIATRLGNRLALTAGVVGAVLVATLWGLVPSAAIVALGILVLILALALIQNGGLPVALAQVPVSRAGLGVGLYLGGVSAANLLQNALQAGLLSLSLGGLSLLGAAALLVAIALLWARKPSPTPG